MVKVVVEFGGGLDVLFGKAKRLELYEAPPAAGAAAAAGGDAAAAAAPDVRALLAALAPRLTQRRELFLLDTPGAPGATTVRPGILVLVNDADWELEGGLDAQLGEGDVVAFISTLHGG